MAKTSTKLHLQRRCNVCGAKSNLVLDRRKPGGVAARCRECRNGAERLANREGDRRQPDYWRTYRANNRETWLANNRAQQKRRRSNPKREHLAIGQAVRAWRQANGVSQRKLASALGVHQRTVFEREKGINAWPPADLVKLQMLGVELPEEAMTVIGRAHYGLS